MITIFLWNQIEFCVYVYAQLRYPTSTTMTTHVSGAEHDPELEPRVNRRRPFDLHWRKAPPAWPGSVDAAYRRLNPRHRTTGVVDDDNDPCCLQCGCRPCPYDHEEEKERRKPPEVDFVATLFAERNSLLDQLSEVMQND